MKKQSILRIILCLTVIVTVLVGASITAFADDKTPEWVGSDDRAKSYAGITTYVSEDGTHSAAVVADGITWVYYSTSYDQFWIGIDNPDGIFEEGSRFSVRWTADEDSGRHGAFNVIPDTEERRVDQLSILEIGVESPDGEAYRNLTQTVSLYLEPIDCVDSSYIHCEYVGDTRDEIVDKSFVTKTAPDGNREGFIKIKLTHIGEQLHFDWRSPLHASVFSEYQPMILCACASLLIGVVVGVLIEKIVANARLLKSDKYNNTDENN